MTPEEMVAAALAYCRHMDLRPHFRRGGITFGVFDASSMDGARLEGYLDALDERHGGLLTGAMFQTIAERVCVLRSLNPPGARRPPRPSFWRRLLLAFGLSP
jgi:hypothetical protein